MVERENWEQNPWNEVCVTADLSRAAGGMIRPSTMRRDWDVAGPEPNYS